MRRGDLIGFLVAGVLAVLAPLPARADRATDFQRIQEQEKNQLDMQSRICPPLDAAHPSRAASELLTLQVEHEALVLRTTLPTFTGVAMRRVKIDDQPDWATIVIEGGSAHKKTPIIPLVFSLTRTTLAHLRTETLCLQQSGRVNLILSLQVQTPTGTRVVQLQEQFANSQIRASSICQLMIMEMTPGRAWSPTSWSSDNFADLALQHPLEVNRYLRPLLRQVDSESVLTPDPMLAFELFRDRWTVDAATRAKVTALVARLGGGDFRSRAHAQNAIENLGNDAALVLLHLDRSKLNPEQRARVDAILSPYHPVPESDAARLRSDPEFLTICLYSSDLVIRQSAFAALSSVTKSPLKFDPAADPATRTAQISALRKQLDADAPPTKQP